jgi:hypothetical protein
MRTPKAMRKWKAMKAMTTESTAIVSSRALEM